MPHIALARFWFEGNSFTPVPTPRGAFESREWGSGPRHLAHHAGTATERGAVHGFLAAPPGWQATILASVGHDAPITAAFDFHANMAPEIADLLDGASACRTSPHVDMDAAAAREGGVGARLTRHLGATITEAVVERLTDGRFVTEGPMERGAPVDLGPTCVLRAGSLRIICTTLKEAAVDPAFFALHGIDLAATRLLANKAKNHFRAAFRDRCSAIVECDAPGPAALDLAGLPFRHVPLAWR